MSPLLALLALGLACGGAGEPAAPAAPAPAEQAEPVDLTPVGPLPPFQLTTQAGAPFTQQDLPGKVWVVDFMFTSCPDVCPMLSARMAELARTYAGAEDVRFLSLSVDPRTDTPAVLAAYAERFSADPARWTWLTGEEPAVQAVVVEGFRTMLQRVPAGASPAGTAPAGASAGAPAAGKAPAPESVLHGERFVVLDRQGVIRGYPSPKVPGEVEAYVEAVRKLGG